MNLKNSHLDCRIMSRFEMLIKNFEKCKYSKYHEQMCEEIILQSGYKKFDKCDVIDNYQENYYIHQPNGTQKSPDFIICDNNNIYNIECKSSKYGYKPMWNSGIPDKNTYYVFSSQKYNDTIVIHGSEIISNELFEILTRYKFEAKALADKYNKLIHNLTPFQNPYNINVYPRHMFIQKKHFVDKK